MDNWFSTKIQVPYSVRQQDTLDNTSWRVNLNPARKVILICYHNTQNSASWVESNRKEVLKSPQTFMLHHSFSISAHGTSTVFQPPRLKSGVVLLIRLLHYPVHQEILLVLPSNTYGVQVDPLLSLPSLKPSEGPAFTYNEPALALEVHTLLTCSSCFSCASLLAMPPPIHQATSYPGSFCFK